MKVTLIDYTGAGSNDPDYAVNVLIFTKNTRLTMSPSLLKDIAAWPKDKKMAELEYMANTIPSSWEFVDYTFMIEGVTRAFTHQLIRTRTASYAQQTMRVLKMQSWEHLVGPSVANSSKASKLYAEAMTHVALAYDRMLNEPGVNIEDARGILPTNILTNIVMKINMRNFVELVRKRSSPRTQGEYREVLEQMKERAQAAHPWLALFIDRTFERAAADLDKEILGVADPEKRMRMVKLLDQCRAQS